MNDIQYPLVSPPNKGEKVLLHSCCAPCSARIMEILSLSGINYTVFFYNPNIHPEQEYLLRKEENIHFAKKQNVPFVDGDYDQDNWFERAQGLEWEPERGMRCTLCFDIRLQRTALFAKEHGFSVMTSSLGISRWKNLNQVNDCGKRAAELYEGLTYWDFNWRKGGNSAQMIEISKREKFYQQEYCGCIYSLRDMNRRRREQGRPAIDIGKLQYGKKD
ncbi:epoxyqueuosine reductase QueH [Zymomonas mobilis]|uniref:Epoxyqueuosine reductase QueH n=1 Tax=Zymomonas mobilis subsp. pomaceae (strain ATCC 29192 / DSM 22645 / JCM 10191 / CCUG 17912 / NBRC 13757 / NCIMB 11200 / NRRL B-4491 / Barker I) TaxID=579138 RepID=F8ET09_ZYMMT|nr:epoxyqueuosine reductase QueH [Zymomonas mobilis]AEI37913.1 protein of unknown function DUF208 [Zymomonas mobilis subsp. pomaceae ATCC 29192]MDX5949281.1 epoxyqueuosine reductase QueH [Zymomonas mobilis subsp. pomaceae]